MMSLFRVLFDGVATAAAHPPLWPNQTGLCCVCLFAHDNEDALERAKTIVDTLPFVFLDEHPILGHAAIIYDCDGPRRTDLDTSIDDWEVGKIWKDMEANARLSGLAFAFCPVTHVDQPPVADARVLRFIIAPQT